MIDDVMSNEMRKGFLKMVVLKTISRGPIHGYDIIQEIEARTRGRWAPSPGSVYPVLEFLESRGYITMVESDRKKVYSITEEGKTTLDRIDRRRREMFEEFGILFGDRQEENDDTRPCH